MLGIHQRLNALIQFLQLMGLTNLLFTAEHGMQTQLRQQLLPPGNSLQNRGARTARGRSEKQYTRLHSGHIAQGGHTPIGRINRGVRDGHPHIILGLISCGGQHHLGNIRGGLGQGLAPLNSPQGQRDQGCANSPQPPGTIKAHQLIHHCLPANKRSHHSENARNGQRNITDQRVTAHRCRRFLPKTVTAFGAAGSQRPSDHHQVEHHERTRGYGEHREQRAGGEQKPGGEHQLSPRQYSGGELQRRNRV